MGSGRCVSSWLAAAGIVLTGCAAYPTGADIEVISNQIAAANGRSREAAVGRALAERGAVPMSLAEESITIPREVESCDGRTAPRPVSVTGRSATYEIDCAALANLAWGRGPVDARTADGRPVVLVASRTGANDGIVIGARPDHHVVVVEPQLEVTERHKIRRRGSCDRMPSPPLMPAFVTVFALESHDASELERVPATYRGETTEYVCDHYDD